MTEYMHTFGLTLYVNIPVEASSYEESLRLAQERAENDEEFCAFTEGLGFVHFDVVEHIAEPEALDCDSCGSPDGARWDQPDGSAVCDLCND